LEVVKRKHREKNHGKSRWHHPNLGYLNLLTMT
jgi:hypothetical protein